MLFDILTGKGLYQFEWWGYVLIALGLTHITIACVTLYLHRSQAHRGVDFHPIISHFMRFWLWLTTGLVTAEWVAVHRKHHAKVETEADPHSPLTLGIKKVLYCGAELYREEAKNQETISSYSHSGLPDDRLEKRLYAAQPSLGILSLLLAQFVLFGFFGIAIWAIQMVWIPFFAAGVINGIAHYIGYRNFDADDNSTNISNIAILIGGEELHNNHHAYPSSAKLSAKWWEFDIGWLYIKTLSAFGLAKVIRVAPVPVKKHSKEPQGALTQATLKSLIQGRPHVLREYVVKVIKPVYKTECWIHNRDKQRWLQQVKHALFRHQRHVSEIELKALKEAIVDNAQLEKVYEFKKSLEDLLHNCRDQNVLLQALHEWCRQAETSGIQVLSSFAERLRNYRLTSQVVAVH